MGSKIGLEFSFQLGLGLLPILIRETAVMEGVGGGGWGNESEGLFILRKVLPAPLSVTAQYCDIFTYYYNNYYFSKSLHIVIMPGRNNPYYYYSSTSITTPSQDTII